LLALPVGLPREDAAAVVAPIGARRLVAWALAGIAVPALVLLMLASSASAAVSPELKRYPYLTDVVGNSATVNWATTRFSIAGVLKYGRVGTESCTAHTVSTSHIAVTVGSASEFLWKAQLSGLAPDTAYCYRLYLGQSSQVDLLGTDPAPQLRSQIPRGANTPYTFAVFGDWGFVHADGTNPDQANVMHQIATSGARFAVTTGDNAYPSGSQQNYGDLTQVGADTSAVFGPNFWTVAGSTIPLFPAMGNHGFSGGTTALNNWPEDVAVATSNGRQVKETYCCLNGTTSADYPSIWYAFDAGNARFYVLEAAWADTNPGSSTSYGNDYAYHWAPDRAEYRWLQNDLATHPRALKFAFFHYPLYADSASENTDDFLHGVDSLEGLLNRYGVDVAFAGHAHIYQQNIPSTNGLPNYTTGGGGADLESIAGGSANCSPLDAYGIGWSDTSQLGNACGSAPVPTSASQVFHFLKVGVNGSGITITPTDSLGQTFDEQTYQVSPANADLSLTNSDSPDPAITDQVVTYRLTAHNGGSSDAGGVVVTDGLPAGVEYVSAAPSQGTCSQAAGTVTCALGALASGADATVDVSVKSPSAGTVTNKASIVADDLIDPDEANNSVSESTTVQAGADLSLTQSDSPDPVVVGEDLTYTLAVHNRGPLDADNVVVADDLPSGATYRSATPSQGTCTEGDGTVACFLGALANGADATVQVVVTPQSTGVLTNGASTASDEPDGADANNYVGESTTVTQLADLSITNSDSPDPVGVGQTLTYTLTVHDSGPADAPNVRVTDALPAGVVYQSATPSQGSCAQASGTVTCDLGTIANGGGATVTIKITPQTAGSITDTASVTNTGTVDPSSANDSASASTTVKTVADLSITNVDSPDPVPVSKLLTYTITVRNNGPTAAANVSVTDPLPATVTFSSATTSLGTCFQSVPGTVTCNVASLASGGRVDIKIQVTAQSPGTSTNTASVQSDQVDAIPANNSATATTTVTALADVQVVQTDSPDPVFVGGTLTYAISVKNNGPSPASGVTMTDSLPTKNVSYQSATTSQGTCSLSGANLTCSLGTMASGSTAGVTVRVTATKDDKNVQNKVSVSATEADPATGNNSANEKTQIQR
jgi:uncharacterized repeat protein (TIGR01451 family)